MDAELHIIEQLLALDPEARERIFAYISQRTGEKPTTAAIRKATSKARAKSKRKPETPSIDRMPLDTVCQLVLTRLPKRSAKVRLAKVLREAGLAANLAAAKEMVDAVAQKADADGLPFEILQPLPLHDAKPLVAAFSTVGAKVEITIPEVV